MPVKNVAARAEYQRKYQLERAKRRRSEWLLANGPCKYCGSWERLEIDHIDQTKKEYPINSMWLWAAERRNKELAKCQPLCHECHKQKTILSLRRPIIHGTHGGYSKGCRCDLCRQIQIVRMDKYHTLHPRKKNSSGLAQVGGAPVL